MFKSICGGYHNLVILQWNDAIMIILINYDEMTLDILRKESFKHGITILKKTVEIYYKTNNHDFCVYFLVTV